LYDGDYVCVDRKPRDDLSLCMVSPAEETGGELVGQAAGGSLAIEELEMQMSPVPGRAGGGSMVGWR
jgi:hypothetical protein